MYGRWTMGTSRIAAYVILVVILTHDYIFQGFADNFNAPEKSIAKRRLLLSDARIRSNNRHIIVVGSVNADTFLSVLRLPVEGENLTTLCEPTIDVPGGKGCTQAVAAAKLLLSTLPSAHDGDISISNSVTFIGQFGNDNAANVIRSTLQDVGVNIDHSGRHTNIGSGRGYVFTAQDSGAVSAVVSGGANTIGWNSYETLWDEYIAANRDQGILQSSDINLNAMFSKLHVDSSSSRKSCDVVLMLQREIPEKVNLLVATFCRLFLKDEHGTSFCIVLDGGGEDRPISSEMLQLCDYIMPNESELRRLVKPLLSGLTSRYVDIISSSDSLSNENVVNLAKVLLEHGARNVLVTRGKYGSTLVSSSSPATEHFDMNSHVITYHHPACYVENVIDETGAGDCYRAGFVAACLLLQQKQQSKQHHDVNYIKHCMAFATAAGSLAVTQRGAVPATPLWDGVMVQLDKVDSTLATQSEPKPQMDALRGGGNQSTFSNDVFPYGIGSRLNSMKDRSELWGSELKTPKDYVKRQASIKGLTCIDFNYPQHFHNFWSVSEAKSALDEAGLVAGAVCLRYEAINFARGAMNHPDTERRREAIQITKDAAQTAIDLGCNEVVVWSAFDGYDYPFQVDYDTKWQELVDAFQECCDAYPSVKFSLEYKPTDENTRFFTVPSTGAALLMVHDVNRSNFGLTLDVGHMLMSGENPGQSISMVGRVGKLFGIQLNDGYTRLAAEDGLMFGSVHPRMAMEIMYQLQKINFNGHIYFDTFPQRSDPIKEAEYNIRRVKAFWKAATLLHTNNHVSTVMNQHDAIGALELVDKILDSSKFNAVM